MKVTNLRHTWGGLGGGVHLVLPVGELEQVAIKGLFTIRTGKFLWKWFYSHKTSPCHLTETTKRQDFLLNVLAKAMQLEAWPLLQSSQLITWSNIGGAPGLWSRRYSNNPRGAKSQIQLRLPQFSNCWCPVQPQLHQLLKGDVDPVPSYQLQQFQWETEVKNLT